MARGYSWSAGSASRLPVTSTSSMGQRQARCRVSQATGRAAFLVRGLSRSLSAGMDSPTLREETVQSILGARALRPQHLQKGSEGVSGRPPGEPAGGPPTRPL